MAIKKSPVLHIEPTGRMNRRDLPNKIGDKEVRLRENFYVLGNSDEKRNRKVPGANRFSDNNTGTSYTSGYRYYTKKDVRKTFAFNNGKIYFIDDNGNETADTNPFAINAIPCWESVRISDTDHLLFSEGVNTGMYSHDGNIANTWQKQTAVTLNFVQMVGHLDRLFAFEEDSEDLYFSANLDPFNFTSATDAGVITIGAKRGSKIVGITLLYGTIYIFKQDSIWRLSGRTPADFDVTEVHASLGCPARRSIVNVNGGIIFLGSDFEFYQFGGTVDSTVMLSYKVAINGDKTKNLIPIINSSQTDSIVATFHNNIYRCSFVENGGTTNNLEWCFDTINQTDFFTRDFNISCYIKWDRSPDGGELLTGRTDLGRLMIMNVGLNVDNGATNPRMPFKLQTKFYGSDSPRNIRFKKAYFNIGVLGAQPLPVFYYLDTRSLRSGSGTDEVTMRGETRTISGNMKISTQYAISSPIHLDYGKSKGQSIAFEIDHDAKDFDVDIQSIDVEVIVKRPLKLSEKVGI